MIAADRARFVGDAARSPQTGPGPGRRRRADPSRGRHGADHAAQRGPPPSAPAGRGRRSVRTWPTWVRSRPARAGPELPASVHDSGLRWSCATGHSSVTADPPPADALASAGLLRWEFDLPPGGSASVELRVRPDGAGPVRAVGARGDEPAAPARAAGDDPRVAGAAAHEHRGPPGTAAARPRAPLRHPPRRRRALALRPGPGRGARRGPDDPAPGHPARRGHAAHPRPHPTPGPGPRVRHDPRAADGTRARICHRAARARRPPCSSPHCSRRPGAGGCPSRRPRNCCPAAERCLTWLRTAVGDGTYLPDPQPGGPVRCETQAHAHRAALLGADLLDAYGRPGGAGAAAVGRGAADRVPGRTSGSRTAAAAGPPPPAPRTDASCRTWARAAVHLLDTGLLGGGAQAPGPARQGADRTARPAARRPGHGLGLGAAQAWA